MSSSKSKATFKSSLAPLMEQFVQEKRAIGYRYKIGAGVLMRFDPPCDRRCRADPFRHRRVACQAAD